MHLQVPVPYTESADPAELLQGLAQLLAPGGGSQGADLLRGEDEGPAAPAGSGGRPALCLQRLEASMAGPPLLLIQRGRLVPALGEGADGGERRRRELLRAPAPLPRNMGQLCLPAVCDVRLSIVHPASARGQRGSCAEEARQAAVDESVQSPEAAGPSWIALRVLIPQLGAVKARQAHAGKDVGPASPFKWRALASRAAGVDVGGGGGEGRGCFVWVRAGASVEELGALLETHTRVSRSRFVPRVFLVWCRWLVSCLVACCVRSPPS